MLPRLIALWALVLPISLADAGKGSLSAVTTTSTRTVNDVRRRLFDIRREKRDQVFSNSTRLDKSFIDATLFRA
jgi:hypothetical protein